MIDCTDDNIIGTTDGTDNGEHLGIDTYGREHLFHMGRQRIRVRDPDGTLAYEFDLSGDDLRLHHYVEFVADDACGWRELEGYARGEEFVEGSDDG